MADTTKKTRRRRKKAGVTSAKSAAVMLKRFGRTLTDSKATTGERIGTALAGLIDKNAAIDVALTLLAAHADGTPFTALLKGGRKPLRVVAEAA